MDIKNKNQEKQYTKLKQRKRAFVRYCHLFGLMWNELVDQLALVWNIVHLEALPSVNHINSKYRSFISINLQFRSSISVVISMLDSNENVWHSLNHSLYDALHDTLLILISEQHAIINVIWQYNIVSTLTPQSITLVHNKSVWTQSLKILWWTSGETQ